MRYMLMICDDETEPGKPELLAEYGRFSEEVVKRGVMRDAARLRPSAMATTVRVRNGKTLTTDGPFAETKEQLGGYYVLDCKDLDEALEFAAKVPSARHGAIEVRPIWEMGE